MKRLFRRFRRDRKGVSAVEFAMLLPLLILFIVGIAQMGILYFANAGLRNLVAESARYASISPRPSDTAIKAKLQQGGFGLVPAQMGTPTITYGTTSGANYADIQMSYNAYLNFIFFSYGPVTLTEKRRVFIYPT